MFKYKYTLFIENVQGNGRSVCKLAKLLFTSDICSSPSFFQNAIFHVKLIKKYGSILMPRFLLDPFYLINNTEESSRQWLQPAFCLN